MADSPVHSHNQPCICGSVIFGITSNSSMSDELYLTHNQRASAYSGGLSYPGRPAASLRPRKKESREALVRRWSCFPSTYRKTLAAFSLSIVADWEGVMSSATSIRISVPCHGETSTHVRDQSRTVISWHTCSGGHTFDFREIKAIYCLQRYQ